METLKYPSRWWVLVPLNVAAWMIVYRWFRQRKRAMLPDHGEDHAGGG
jgi:hypothetical protein